MKKVFLLKGLDCPHCSAKIEKEVGELFGVYSSNVNLMKLTLTVEAESIDIKDVEEIVHSHEPDVKVSYYEEEKKDEEENDIKKTIIRFVIGGLLFALAIVLSYFFEASLFIKLPVFIISYLILGADVVLGAVRNIIKGKIFDENFLMSLSTIGAFIIGEYPEAVAVMLFYQIGEFFQELSVKRSRKSISDLMNIRPDSANVLRHGSLVTVSPENVRIGEEIVVKPGERIALDGIVTEGESMLDTSALTGESVPRSAKIGDEVLSGCINQSGVLKIKVSKEFSESTVSKIIDLVENASSRKAPTENFITKFARYYTPAVVIVAAILAFIMPIIMQESFTSWIHRGLVFLVISCPCALVLSVPLAFFAGIGAASKHGVLVKGSNYLEALNDVKTFVFDKTGTLTKGVFKVTEIESANGFSKEDVLCYAANAEKLSNHPIAVSVLEAYENEADKDISDFNEISGLGITAKIDFKKILCGNEKLMEKEGIEYVPSEKIGTKVYVSIDGVFAGCIIIADEIKKDSAKAISELKKLGIKKTVMLTGDNEEIAKEIAKTLGVDEYHAQLLPNEKVEILEKLDDKVSFVGDGINDAPVLKRADVGIAMGALGSDAAIEAADIVIMTDEPSKLIDAIKLSKYTRTIVVQNIVFSLLVKGIILILGAIGYAGMWEAVFADVGVAFLAVLNSMRILKK